MQVYPVVAKVRTKATTKDVEAPSPNSTLDRSDSRNTSGNQLEVLSPNVLGGDFVPAKKPKRTHVDKTLGDAAWRYRYSTAMTSMRECVLPGLVRNLPYW